MPGYDQAFYDDQTPIALRSARRVLPRVLKLTGARRVVDVGCGVAAWARVARDEGAWVRGVDGNTPPDALLINPVDFRRVDLTDGYDCSGYDLAICLEVAEHLPKTSAAALVAGLCKARFVLFSGAHPGQGGVNHVNEQWPTWWERLFAEHAYEGSSLISWDHDAWTDPDVQDYYRENIALYGPPYSFRYGAAGVLDLLHPIRTGLW